MVESRETFSIISSALSDCSGADSCSGDSGGPLVYREFSGDPWYQVGLVSFGSSKCGTGKPGIYTRISGYLDWISRHLEE